MLRTSTQGSKISTTYIPCRNKLLELSHDANIQRNLLISKMLENLINDKVASSERAPQKLSDDAEISLLLIQMNQRLLSESRINGKKRQPAKGIVRIRTKMRMRIRTGYFNKKNNYISTNQVSRNKIDL